MNAFLTGYSVIVTGGTKGIGKGIARSFVEAGANVLITGRDELSAKSAVADLIAVGPGSASYTLGDVAKRADMQAMVKVALERNGRIDVLCANAGIFPDSRLDVMSEDDWDLVFDTNVKGNFLALQSCLAALTDSGRGRVILTSSITGPITGFPGWSHYGASKAAQLGFMRTAAIELASRAITVNAVLPGNIATEGLADLGPEYRRSMEAAIPVGRLGEVADIGAAAVFFASPQAAFITGQALAVDGGQTLPESLAALDSQ
ncbi:MAG: 3-oxoacyl-ACP reductase FabG [Actinomycetes bacterium]